MQRERHRSDRGAKLLQSALFAEADPFARWLDADGVRFEYPVVYSAVKREGSAMLDSYGRLLAPLGHPI